MHVWDQEFQTSAQNAGRFSRIAVAQQELRPMTPPLDSRSLAPVTPRSNHLGRGPNVMGWSIEMAWKNGLETAAGHRDFTLYIFVPRNEYGRVSCKMSALFYMWYDRQKWGSKRANCCVHKPSQCTRWTCISQTLVSKVVVPHSLLYIYIYVYVSQISL